jgi:hypothetical protein
MSKKTKVNLRYLIIATGETTLEDINDIMLYLNDVKEADKVKLKIVSDTDGPQEATFT